MNFVRVSNAWKISLFSKKGEKKKTTFDIEEICRISMMKKKKKRSIFRRMRPIKGQRWNSFPRRKVPILMTFFSSKPMSLKPVLRRGIFRADNRILDRGYLSTSLVKISIFLFFFFLKKVPRNFRDETRTRGRCVFENCR